MPGSRAATRPRGATATRATSPVAASPTTGLASTKPATIASKGSPARASVGVPVGRAPTRGAGGTRRREAPVGGPSPGGPRGPRGRGTVPTVGGVGSPTAGGARKRTREEGRKGPEARTPGRVKGRPVTPRGPPTRVVPRRTRGTAGDGRPVAGAESLPFGVGTEGLVEEKQKPVARTNEASGPPIGAEDATARHGAVRKMPTTLVILLGAAVVVVVGAGASCLTSPCSTSERNVNFKF